MAENFRNKQWFKNMSQERKDEICEKFLIDETTLKKAGRETDDGRIVINLLKIDKLNYTPKPWIDYYKILSSNTIIPYMLKQECCPVQLHFQQVLKVMPA